MGNLRLLVLVSAACVVCDGFTLKTVGSVVVAKSPASAANVVLRRLPSIAPARTTTTSLSDNKNDDMNTDNANFFSKFNFFSADGSQTPSTGNDSTYWTRVSPMTGQTRKLQMTTLIKVLIPSIASGLLAYVIFPFLSLNLASLFNDAGVFAVLSQDSSQFVQNFLTVSGLLFSILVGQTFYFMYQQQEQIYLSLFSEVTEAKSLLEQSALLCGGRPMYYKVLSYINNYLQNDLKNSGSVPPALLLSSRPIDDPLESVMYITSVGTPSYVYDTVRSLRQARATRLGAIQKKLPSVHVALLWILALIELVSFPFLGAGTQTIGGYNVLSVEGFLFGVMTFGIVMTLSVVTELWEGKGGAYNFDGVLGIMVQGLEEELAGRLAQEHARISNLPGFGNDGGNDGNALISSDAQAAGAFPSPLTQQGVNKVT